MRIRSLFPVTAILFLIATTGIFPGPNMTTSWENAVSPGAGLEELAALDQTLFARSNNTLYKSTDFGSSWQEVAINLDIQYLLDMDVDNGNIYIATEDGVIVSSDGGKVFKWSFDSTPDTSTCVDFEKGYGWLIVDMWGTPSGPHRKTPGGNWAFARGDIPWNYMGVLRSIVADRKYPGNVAFTYGSRGDTGPRYFRTVNGGQNWMECQTEVIYTTIIDNTPYALGNSKYSTDNGKTWQNLPFTCNTFLENPAGGNLFAAKNSGGVYIGTPDYFQAIGPGQKTIQSFALCGDYLFALSTIGEIFKRDLTRVPCNSVCASNQSTETLCAEEDNINIPISGVWTSFVIEASHPAYHVGTDNCNADFTNCPAANPGYPFTPRITELYNDGETIVEAVTESEWWLPNGMEARADDGEAISDVHYIRIYRENRETGNYPQFLVLYMDGNLRLIPHPPAGADRVCFGSSVVVGPAVVSERPYAEITSVTYNSSLQRLDVYYKAGGSAVLAIDGINRTFARIKVNVNYSSEDLPFATFRSMFIKNGNADADSVRWVDVDGTEHDGSILTFPGGEGTGWFFYRNHRSQHNTSSPDIWIGAGNRAAEPPQIQLSRNHLYFGGIQGGPVTSSQDFVVTNTGGGTLNWAITKDQKWLNGTPLSGTGSGPVSVSIDPTGLAAGTYNGTVTVSDPAASNSPQLLDVTLTVFQQGRSGIPFGEFATPVEGASASSSIPVTGWALDDIGIAGVKIYRGSERNLVYIGDAVLVEGARPDVEQAFPTYPMNYKAGWGYMLLTNFLPDGGNGTYTLYAAAVDFEGNEVSLGARTITCDNAGAINPFGAIDTPAQGGTAEGTAFINWGWALTPQPNEIPTNGSTIKVFIDGVELGNPVYNIYRDDIAELFPGYQNSGGAVGYYKLDTTPHENGVHTIYWTVTDNAGNSAGIGSRYFTILNSQEIRGRTAGAKNGGWEREYCGMFSQTPLDRFSPVGVIKGSSGNSGDLRIYPDDNGIVTIKIKELERVEIHFEDSPLSHQYTGYSVVGDQLRGLPTGSALNSEKGIFYWCPGPGFVGNYHFIFFERSKDSKVSKRIVIITIEPMASSSE